MCLISSLLLITPDPLLYISSSPLHGRLAHETHTAHIWEHLFFQVLASWFAFQDDSWCGQGMRVSHKRWEGCSYPTQIPSQSTNYLDSRVTKNGRWCWLNTWIKEAPSHRGDPSCSFLGLRLHLRLLYFACVQQTDACHVSLTVSISSFWHR